MSDNLLEHLTVTTKDDCDASVIWLHGLGASGNDFLPIVGALHLPHELGIRFIFPEAPKRPVHLNAGFVMPAWFDIYGLTPDAKIDYEGLVATNELIADLIEQEHQRGVPYERIIIVGFSQGGAMALYTGLHFPHKLAGIMGLSTLMPDPKDFKHNMHPANHHTPIFIAAGEHDQVVLPVFTEMAAQQLQDLNFRVELHHYSMEHTVCEAEVADIRQWILKRLNFSE